MAQAILLYKHCDDVFIQNKWWEPHIFFYVIKFLNHAIHETSVIDFILLPTCWVKKCNWLKNSKILIYTLYVLSAACYFWIICNPLTKLFIVFSIIDILNACYDCLVFVTYLDRYSSL